MSDNADKEKRRAELRDELARIERELRDEPEAWQLPDSEYYGMYHATGGFALGILGAAASLLFNVLGASVVGLHPLRLIQVYLTFPLGERALADDFDTGIVLAIGCCLYLGTGMLLGIPFQLVMARLLPKGNLIARLALATVLGVLLWLINFYGILSWLQPMVCGGNWIIDPEVLPPWVGVATHLVFAWTMAVVFPWARYRPYRRPTQQVAAANS